MITDLKSYIDKLQEFNQPTNTLLEEEEFADSNAVRLRKTKIGNYLTSANLVKKYKVFENTSNQVTENALLERIDQIHQEFEELDFAAITKDKLRCKLC